MQILVEGTQDYEIVKQFLKLFGLDKDFVVDPVGGKSTLKKYFLEYVRIAENHNNPPILLFDLDEPGTFNSKKEIEDRLGIGPSDFVYAAIPSIESWLLSDKSALLKFTESQDVISKIERISNPEEVPYPKVLVSNILGKFEKNRFKYLDLIDQIDLKTALLSSYSLREFYAGLCKHAGVEPKIKIKMEKAESISDKKIYTDLLYEVADMGQIIYRTLDGEAITAKGMIDEINMGTYLSHDYIRNILRIARNLLAHQAKSGKSGER